MKHSWSVLKRVVVSVLKAHFRGLRSIEKHFFISAILFIPVMITIAILIEGFLGFVASFGNNLEETIAFNILGFSLAFYAGFLGFLFFVAFVRKCGGSFEMIDKIENRLLGDE